MFDKIPKIFVNQADSTSTVKMDTIINKAKTPAAPLPIISSERKRKDKVGEIKYDQEITDQQIERQKYIQSSIPRSHKVVSGETLSSISRQYGISLEALYVANPSFNKDTKLSIGQNVNIPVSRKIVNVKNLKDVAKAMGLSYEYVLQWKKAEDAPNTPDNSFHNTVYVDGAGVETIGVGHALQTNVDKQEIIKKYGSLKLTDAQVCNLFASDLLETEENIVAIIGQNNYDNLPQPMKEALLDMVFNKGNAIIKETEGLAYCLKTGKCEAAINKFTNIKSAKTGEEMAGLAKRRLFDISIATKMYEDGVPQSNINTAQQLYDRGIELLRKECAEKGLDFESQLLGFNEDVQGYFGERIQLKYQTK